ncbi:MAG: HEPN domain-containing protein [Kofleriaceae bacterium]|nr:HEPN domain-containing protein [Kofleriaceae bacterium]
MTEELRRTNIRDEIARAEDALKAAEALIPLALFADAISRSYYGVFHALRALAFTRGIEPRTHAGVIHVFNTEFVRTGLFPSSFNRTLSGLQRSRELADYDAAVVFSEPDARAELVDARAFVTAALAWLASEGWLSSPGGT